MKRVSFRIQSGCVEAGLCEHDAVFSDDVLVVDPVPEMRRREDATQLVERHRADQRVVWDGRRRRYQAAVASEAGPFLRLPCRRQRGGDPGQAELARIVRLHGVVFRLGRFDIVVRIFVRARDIDIFAGCPLAVALQAVEAIRQQLARPCVSELPGCGRLRVRVVLAQRDPMAGWT